MKASQAKLRTMLLSASAMGAIAPIGLWVAYAYVFRGGISSEQSDWAALGSYVGGTSAAILSLLSLLAVLYTIYIQTDVLRRSTIAQEQAAKYARLTALVTLQEHYLRVSEHQGTMARTMKGTQAGALALERIGELDRQYREATQEIEKYHAALISSAG